MLKSVMCSDFCVAKIYCVLTFLLNVLCYDLNKHYGDFGLLTKNGVTYDDSFWCYCSVIDNAHLLTSTSCFFIGSKVHSPNQPFPQVSNFTLKRFDSSGDLSIKLEIDKVIRYPFTKLFSGDSINFYTTAKDDFSLLILKEKLPFGSDIMLIEWPLSIHEDYENLMDFYESQGIKANVLSHNNKESIKPSVYEAIFINRIHCKKLLGCANPKYKFGCAYFNGEYNVRCVLNAKPNRCLFDVKGAPVFLDEILWGITVDCFENITYYVAFDRSFKFIFDVIKSKPNILGQNHSSINSIIAIVVVIIINLIAIFIYVMCHAFMK